MNLTVLAALAFIGFAACRSLVFVLPRVNLGKATPPTRRSCTGSQRANSFAKISKVKDTIIPAVAFGIAAALGTAVQPARAGVSAPLQVSESFKRTLTDNGFGDLLPKAKGQSSSVPIFQKRIYAQDGGLPLVSKLIPRPIDEVPACGMRCQEGAPLA